MTDNEINVKLALAIGYLPEHVKVAYGVCVVYRAVVAPHPNAGWYEFDHTHWKTIGPIAERFDLFPNRDGNVDWYVLLLGEVRHEFRYGKTPQEAIALAVIERAK